MIRLIGGFMLVGLILLATAFAFGLVSIQQTRDARVPEISVKSGALPEYRADVAKVKIGTRDETIQVPTVDVEKPKDQ